MRKIRLGRTGIEATAQSFGALPIQRTETEEAVRILRAAVDGGINYFDTARAYTDSEEKIGKAFSPSVRQGIYIATKSGGKNKEAVLNDIRKSLSLLKTDYVDLLQAHNITAVPDENDENSIYAGLKEAQRLGYCRFIGVTSHRLDVAKAAIETGLYDTMQFPISYLSAKEDLELIDMCKKADMGMVAMKGLAGGAISSAKAAAAFMNLYPTLLPIWGIQHMWELEEFLEYGKNPPEMTEELQAAIAKDKTELSGNFCRACGYCMPCTAAPEMEMNTTMRMYFNLRRMPPEQFLSEHWQKQMLMIEKCINCGACKRRCPYGLDCPAVLKRNLADYREFCKAHGIVI